MGNLLTPTSAPALYAANADSYKNTREVLQQLNPQQPIYLFDQARLIENMQDFQASFPGMTSYAVKANTRKRVLRTLIEQGMMHFDVASIAEIKILRALNSEVQLHYNNPVKAKADIALAYAVYSVRSFALDDVLELEKLLSVCTRPEQLTLSVRFKLSSHCSAYDFGSKFGADMSNAADLLRRIKRSGAAPALTFHPGSQCTRAEEYQRYIRAAAEIANNAGVTLAQLNVGGGFPEYYANTTAPPRRLYFDLIRQTHATAFSSGRPPRLMCEPGRAMVAASTSLLCRVIHVRGKHSRVFINDGIYGGLQEQSLAVLDLPMRCWRKGRIVNQAMQPYTVFGPTCDPVDRLPRTLMLPVDISEGDYLQFALMGAYGSATSTRFNGFDSGDYINVAHGWPTGPK